MLEVQDLHVHYGMVEALKGINLRVLEQEIVCLIGANGAGKTTLLNALSGVVRSSGGRILLEGRDLRGQSPPQVVALGVVQVPEGRQVFYDLSVMENLEMGAYLRIRKQGKAAIQEDLEEIWRLFPILADRRRQMAGTLSGGEQQMLALARGLMARPRLMMLDEPSLGLAPLIVKEIFGVIRLLPQRSTAVLLVEQNARAALQISGRGYVMETGRITMEGDSRSLAQDEGVKAAFLGRHRGDGPSTEAMGGKENGLPTE
jgi:branched-chain amino acid transport system ATP-binding protein